MPYDSRVASRPDELVKKAKQSSLSGDYAKSRRLYEDARILYQQQSNRLGEAVVHLGIGEIEGLLGNYVAARDNYSQAMDALQDLVRDALHSPIKPIEVSKKDAPCKENIITGDDIDLYKFPAPMIHDGDGGRYLGTWNTLKRRNRQLSSF